jgi:Type II secretion system (T2SS), protein M subtype b
MTLARRIFVEKRALIIPVAVGVVLNIAAYLFVVRPLALKSAGVADRAIAAREALTLAERDLAAARALVTGTSRADEELATFYEQVLPPDQNSARRLTYLSIYHLARQMNVKFLARKTEGEPPKRDARVGRWKIRAELQGDYENLRQFIYALESAPAFVIIDDVTLSQNDAAKPLTLTIELSSYYRLDAHGN